MKTLAGRQHSPFAIAVFHKRRLIRQRLLVHHFSHEHHRSHGQVLKESVARVIGVNLLSRIRRKNRMVWKRNQVIQRAMLYHRDASGKNDATALGSVELEHQPAARGYIASEADRVPRIIVIEVAILRPRNDHNSIRPQIRSLHFGRFLHLKFEALRRKHIFKIRVPIPQPL